jgi:Protein of unknown function (DUF2442)
MIKVTKILNIDNYNITCLFNNGIVKIIEVEPLLKSHSNLKGIEKLFNLDTFNRAKVGLLGEILWEKIISIEYNGQVEIWDYDISPEFIMAVGKNNMANTAV